MEPIPASFRSTCGICGDLIHEGDEIVKVEDEWVHERCGEDWEDD